MSVRDSSTLVTPSCAEPNDPVLSFLLYSLKSVSNQSRLDFPHQSRINLPTRMVLNSFDLQLVSGIQLIGKENPMSSYLACMCMRVSGIGQACAATAKAM